MKVSFVCGVQILFRATEFIYSEPMKSDVRDAAAVQTLYITIQMHL